jgi:hypothetical protein
MRRFKLGVSRESAWLTIAALVIAVACAVLAWSRTSSGAAVRIINHDEGFYLQAARLAARGEAPYLDFFFPQMPLVPWLYGMVSPPDAVALVEARRFSALLTALLVVVASGASFIVARRWTDSKVAALVAGAAAGLAVGLNPMVQTWHTTLKTHALAGLMIAVAVAATAWAACAPSRRSAFLRGGLAGFALGAATLAKLYIAALGGLLLPAVLAPILTGTSAALNSTERSTRVRTALQVAGAYLAGAALAGLPALRLAWLAPQQFYFDNIGYHVATDAWRAARGEARVNASGKWSEFYSFASQPATAVLIAAAVAGTAVVVVKLYRERPPTLARSVAAVTSLPVLSFLAALVLTAVFVGPMVPFDEYWTGTVALFALAAVPLFSSCTGALGRPLAVLAVVATITVVTTTWRQQQQQLLGWQARAAKFPPNGPAGVSAVAADAKRAAQKAGGSQVLTLWPGYAASSGLDLVRGGEGGIFTYRLGKRLRAPHTDVLDKKRAQALLRQGEPHVVVRGIDWPKELDRDLKKYYEPLADAKVRQSVWVRRSSAPSEAPSAERQGPEELVTPPLEE